MGSSNRTYDDLTKIKGIGSTRQQWLREIAICTFQELITSTASEIENRLKANGHSISRNEIERWQTQAGEYTVWTQHLPAPNKATARTQTDAEVSRLIQTKLPAERATLVNKVDVREVVRLQPVKGETLQRSERVVMVESEAQTGTSEWKPFASFVVEFQSRPGVNQVKEQRTKAHYVEGDQDELWPGLEGRWLCQWMLDQIAREESPESKQALSTEVEPTLTSRRVVKVLQVQAFQPPENQIPSGLGQAGQPFSGVVRGEQPFALEVSFCLAGPAAANLAKQRVGYQVQFHARCKSTGSRLHLGDTPFETLVEGQSTYTARLSPVVLPPGMYRLQVSAMLQVKSVGTGCFELPLFQVI